MQSCNGRQAVMSALEAVVSAGKGCRARLTGKIAGQGCWCKASGQGMHRARNPNMVEIWSKLEIFLNAWINRAYERARNPNPVEIGRNSKYF
jgi:hypothetical protein